MKMARRDVTGIMKARRRRGVRQAFEMARMAARIWRALRRGWRRRNGAIARFVVNGLLSARRNNGSSHLSRGVMCGHRTLARGALNKRSLLRPKRSGNRGVAL